MYKSSLHTYNRLASLYNSKLKLRNRWAFCRSSFSSSICRKSFSRLASVHPLSFWFIGNKCFTSIHFSRNVHKTKFKIWPVNINKTDVNNKVYLSPRWRALFLFDSSKWQRTHVQHQWNEYKRELNRLRIEWPQRHLCVRWNDRSIVKWLPEPHIADAHPVAGDWSFVRNAYWHTSLWVASDSDMSIVDSAWIQRIKISWEKEIKTNFDKKWAIRNCNYKVEIEFGKTKPSVYGSPITVAQRCWSPSSQTTSPIKYEHAC